MKVLVTAAHGNQGQLLLPKLQRAGLSVRALRGAGPREALIALGAAEAITGDAADPLVLDRAMAGVDTVYFVGPSAHPAERDMGLRMIDAAKKAGVKHVIYSSVLHPIISAMPHHALKRDIEEKLISSGLDFTILQPADYMKVVSYRETFASGVYKRWWPLDRREELVDLEDVTDVALKVIREGAPHYGATYPLCSGDCLTGHAIGAAIGRAIGKPVKCVETGAEDFLRGFFGAAADDPAFAYTLDVLRKLNAWHATHDFVGNPHVLTMLLGRKPNSFETVVRREYAAWRAANL
jgi:uncharacterized protein YbjT (DUF2867 family)